MYWILVWHEYFLCVTAIQSADVIDTWNRKCTGTSVSGDNPLWITLIYTVFSIVEALKNSHLDHSSGHPDICYSFMIASNLNCTTIIGIVIFHSLEEVRWTTEFCVQASLMLVCRNQTQLQPSKTWPLILNGKQSIWKRVVNVRWTESNLQPVND